MPRGLTTNQKAELAKRVRAPAYFVALALASGTIRVWNGVGTVLAGGHSWGGLGELGIIDGLEHDLALSAGRLTLQLAGVPTSLLTPGIVAGTRSERYQGRPVTVYFGLLDPDTGVSLHDPLVVWDGFADVLTLQLGRTFNASLTCEHFDSHMRRTNGERMTVEHHTRAQGVALTDDFFFSHQNRLLGRPKPLLEV